MGNKVNVSDHNFDDFGIGMTTRNKWMLQIHHLAITVNFTQVEYQYLMLCKFRQNSGYWSGHGSMRSGGLVSSRRITIVLE
jgi:hypothetical protein